MKRTTTLLIQVALLSVPVFLLGQDQHSKPAPLLPAPVVGPQLIIWSQLQKPQPVPQPLPDPPEERPGKQRSSAPAPSAPEQSSTLTLTGRIVKDGGRYVLKVAKDAPYQLDDQEKAEQYENKEVKVHGTLNENSRQMRILSIELIS